MTIAAILGAGPHAGGREIHTLPSTATVRDAVARLAEHRIGALPVMDGDEVAGILSERDIVRLLGERGGAVLDMPVTEAMTAPAVTVRRDEPVIGALSLMTRRRIRHLPVVEDGRLVGLVSIGDLVKHRIDRIEADAAAMRDYIQSAERPRTVSITAASVGRAKAASQPA